MTGKAIETYDVTDALRDQETRLRLAERARERLYQLLEKSTDVQQRLAILREIRRLTDEIEQARLTLELLKNQVALSRITVELQQRRPEGEARRAGIPFPWIAAMNPLYPSLSRSAGRAVPVLSDDFAVFRKESSFRAESPEGTRVRLGGTGNTPRGDEAFWQKALIFHLGPQYRKAEPLETGERGRGGGRPRLGQEIVQGLDETGVIRFMEHRTVSRVELPAKDKARKLGAAQATLAAVGAGQEFQKIIPGDHDKFKGSKFDAAKCHSP